MKILLNTIGSIALVLAICGLFLPLLPTTPFLLLASACYMRGSERMHRWLLGNRLFGEHLRNYQEQRGISLRSKIIAICFTWISLGFSIAAVGPTWLKLMLTAIGIGVTAFLLWMKTLPAPASPTHDA